MTEWTANANEALSLRLVRAKEDEGTLSDSGVTDVFHPSFTYPIFGDEEKIYGYSNLSIHLHFASGSLRQFLSISSSAKLTGNTVDDIEGTLYKFIPPDYTKDAKSFAERVEQDAISFKPFGQKIYSYTRRDGSKGKGKTRENAPISEDDDDAVVHEVYWLNWKTPGFREYHRRMQLFILLYIEGGSYIQEDEDKWEFVVLYERRRRKDASKTPTYHFAGYSSLYPFFCWPDKVRMRLSQFVILPPYQKSGHGASLYKAIYSYALSQSNIAELTIEDPSEAFEDLRDKTDLRMLFGHEEFKREAYGSDGKKGKLEPPSDKAWVEKWRKDMKMANRQFERLMEMLILRTLDPMDEKANQAYRLQVKERLYRFNYEIMVTLDKDERREKLEETFQSVRDDYVRILGLVE